MTPTFTPPELLLHVPVAHPQWVRIAFEQSMIEQRQIDEWVQTNHYRRQYVSRLRHLARADWEQVHKRVAAEADERSVLNHYFALEDRFWSLWLDKHDTFAYWESLRNNLV